MLCSSSCRGRQRKKKGKEGAHGGHGVAEAKAKDARFVGDECKTAFRLFLHAVNCPVVGPHNLICNKHNTLYVSECVCLCVCAVCAESKCLCVRACANEFQSNYNGLNVQISKITTPWRRCPESLLLTPEMNRSPLSRLGCRQTSIPPAKHRPRKS